MAGSRLYRSLNPPIFSGGKVIDTLHFQRPRIFTSLENADGIELSSDFTKSVMYSVPRYVWPNASVANNHASRITEVVLFRMREVVQFRHMSRSKK